ncbi:hydrolase [Spirochaetia bacterium]|nr:hydrolase [Spirochaetia bacterium]
MSNSLMAVFLDIDGTLVTVSEGPFSDDIAEIETAHQRGHRIFLCTGRSLGYIPPEFQEAPWVDGIVAGAGTHVLLAGKTIYHKWIAPNLLHDIIAFYQQNKKGCIFEGENDMYALNPGSFDMIHDYYHIIETPDDFETKYKGAVITKLTMEGEKTREERNFLENHFRLNAFENYFEGIILGESKSKGMNIIIEAIGIPRENTIAIGDSENDLDIIRAAGIGIAMGNACAELKAAAREITGNCGKGGVGQAIKKFVLTDDGD